MRTKNFSTTKILANHKKFSFQKKSLVRTTSVLLGRRIIGQSSGKNYLF